MKRFSGLALTAGVVAGLAAVAGPGVADTGDREAKIIFPPTPREIAEAYPMPARSSGKDANVTLRCILTSEAGLRACAVKDESPKAMGFGDAALSIMPELMFDPEIKNGKAVDTTVTIPVHFTGAGTPLGTHIAGAQKSGVRVTNDLYGDSNRWYIGQLEWQAAPTYDEVLAAYPAKAKAKAAGARASLGCFIGPGGGLAGCAVQSEYPAGLGAGDAAKTLVSRFRAPTKTASGESTAGRIVLVPVAFTPRMLSGGGVGAPILLSSPDGAALAASLPDAVRKASQVSAHVILGCTVAQGGTMTGCKAVVEDPPGHGLGDAALKVAPRFKVNPWSDEGLPVVGAPVRLPVTYELKAGVPVAQR